MRKVILTLEDGFAIDKSYLPIDKRCNENLDFCTEGVNLDVTIAEQEIDFSVIKYGDIK
jgi:hypothetical protein